MVSQGEITNRARNVMVLGFISVRILFLHYASR